MPDVWDHFGVRVVADVFDTGSGLVNMVAAMPSLHAAYPATLLLFFWNDGKWWRIVLGAYTLAMGFALVYGGEHYLVDILVGWALRRRRLHPRVRRLAGAARARARTRLRLRVQGRGAGNGDALTARVVSIASSTVRIHSNAMPLACTISTPSCAMRRRPNSCCVASWV